MKQDIQAFDTQILELVPDRLYSIASTIALDGRVSAYPANVRGYAPGHCYLLKEGNDALLLDSGYAAYRSQIIASLHQLLAPGDELSIFPLRLNEYMSVCNVEAIAQHVQGQAVLFRQSGRERSGSTFRPPLGYQAPALLAQDHAGVARRICAWVSATTASFMCSRRRSA